MSLTCPGPEPDGENKIRLGLHLACRYAGWRLRQPTSTKPVDALGWPVRTGVQFPPPPTKASRATLVVAFCFYKVAMGGQTEWQSSATRRSACSEAARRCGNIAMASKTWFKQICQNWYSMRLKRHLTPVKLSEALDVICLKRCSEDVSQGLFRNYLQVKLDFPLQSLLNSTSCHSRDSREFLFGLPYSRNECFIALRIGRYLQSMLDYTDIISWHNVVFIG